MSFDWNRIHKHEEQVENDIYDRVSEQICSFYNVEDVADLTIEQMDEVRAFVDNDLNIKENHDDISSFANGRTIQNLEFDNYQFFKYFYISGLIF